MTHFEKLSFCSRGNPSELNVKNVRYNNRRKTEAIKNRLLLHPSNVSESIAKNPYLELRGKKIIVNQKIRPPRYLAQISLWIIGLGILDIETQLKFLKIKWV